MRKAAHMSSRTVSSMLRHGRLMLLLASMASAVMTALAASPPAGEFCALSVEIHDQKDQPARLTPVQLVDPSGRTVFDEQVEGSTVRICDFGFGPHQLRVGYSFCYPITISGLRLILGRSIHLTVRLNQCPPDIWYGRLCRVYLRVREQAGAQARGVNVAWGTNEPPGMTDQFGRVESYLLEGQSTQARLSGGGYVTESVPLECPESEQVIEKEVVLKRISP